ncbi:MAG: hypothetical protein ACI4U5_04955 [Bacilli bacterium]
MKKNYLIVILIGLLAFSSCTNNEKEPIKTEMEIFIEKYYEKYPNGYYFCDGNYIITLIDNIKSNSQDIYSEWYRIEGEFSFLPSHFDVQAYSSSFTYFCNVYDVKTSNVNRYRVSDNVCYHSNIKTYYVEGVKQTEETSEQGEVSQSRIKINVDDDIIRIYNSNYELIRENGYDCCRVYNGNNSMTFSVFPSSNDKDSFIEYTFTYVFDENMELTSIHSYVIENYLVNNVMEMHEKTLLIEMKEKHNVEVDFSTPENLSSLCDFTKEITI